MNESESQKGFTLIEAMLSSLLLLLMVTLFVPTLRLSIMGSTNFEARSALKNAGQRAINRISMNLSACRRLFEWNANPAIRDMTYLAKVDFGGQPGPILNSKLPVKVPQGSLAPGSGGFNAAAVGNGLFFASVKAPLMLDKILDSGGTPHTVRLSNYQFDYYYVGPGKGNPIGKLFNRNLWEWHSVEYADWDGLSDLPADVTLRRNVMLDLQSRGITHAWKISELDASLAFFQLDGATGTMIQEDQDPLKPPHLLRKKSGGMMIDILTGISMGSYRYGVSPNTGAHLTTRRPVPRFATPFLNDFPSGFEVAVVGPSSKLQVLTRLVLVAEGSFPEPIANEQLVTTTAMDSW